MPRIASATLSLRSIRTLALGCVVTLTAAGLRAEVEVVYLANEGFLIASGESKVLVDALFPGIDGYPRLRGGLKADLRAARPPFDGVDLVLATHHHDDHFGAGEVARFLESAPAMFLSTRQAVGRVRAVVGEAPELVAPSPGSDASVSTAEIEVRTLDLHHGRYRDPPVENVGFLIDIGGIRILHIGDTEATLDEFRPLGLAEAGIDVALLPVWYLTEPHWRDVVSEAIRPARIVAMHLAEPSAPASWFGSAGGHEQRIASIQAAWPDAWIPTSPLECRRYDVDAAATETACADPGTLE